MKHGALSSQHLVLTVMPPDYEMTSLEIGAAAHLVRSEHTAFGLLAPPHAQLSLGHLAPNDVLSRIGNWVNRFDLSGTP